MLLPIVACARTDRRTPDEAGTPRATGGARVGSVIHGDEPVTKPLPRLPGEAAAQGVVGPVVLEIRIAETGVVSVVQVVRGHPLLNELAKNTVGNWKYRPVLIEGRAVPIIKVVTVPFVAR
jgi:TonB family protein